MRQSRPRATRISTFRRSRLSGVDPEKRCTICAMPSEEGDPQPDGPVEQARRSSELVRSNARLRLLADVSHAFAMVATDYYLLLQKIARTTADLVGDGCLVT